MFQIDVFIVCQRGNPRDIVFRNLRRAISPLIVAGEREPPSAPADGQDEAVDFLMSRSVHKELLEVLGPIPPEACGMLLGPKSHGSLITHFVRDESGLGSPTSFRIDGGRLNEAMRPFVAAGLDIKGIAHSHPSGCHRPSSGDMYYLNKLFSNRRNAASGSFYFPIISDGRIFHFAYDPSDRWRGMRPARLKFL